MNRLFKIMTLAALASSCLYSEEASDREYALPDHRFPFATRLIPPVFPENPLKTGSKKILCAYLFLDSDGQVYEVIPVNFPPVGFVAPFINSIRSAEFSPGMIDENPLHSARLHDLEHYMFLRDEISAETDAVLPQALWSLDDVLLNALSKKEDLGHRGVKWLRVRLDLDSSGNTIRLKGLSQGSRRVIDALLKPLQSDLNFSPLLINGAARECSLELNVYLNRIDEAPYFVEAPQDTHLIEPVVPKEIQIRKSFERKALICFHRSGQVLNAIYAKEDDPYFTLPVLKAISNWNLDDVDMARADSVTIAEVGFVFKPDSPTAVLQSKPVPKVFTAPELVDRPHVKIPMRHKHTGAEGAILVEMMITEDGVAEEITIVKETHAALAESVVEAFREVRFKPATFDGEPVEARVRQRIYFTNP